MLFRAGNFFQDTVFKLKIHFLNKTEKNVIAQVPEKMSYQAVIRDASGELVTNTKVGVRVRIQKYILGFPPSYHDVYVETHSVYKTNENGL